jgi:selenoprotein W-related protein
MERRGRVTIEYCTQCRWLLRASWLAQELLTTFEAELAEVALLPGTGGVLDVRVDGELIFSRAQAGRFPEAKELKQAVRDRVAPGRDLGHSDASAARARSEAKPSEVQRA